MKLRLAPAAIYHELEGNFRQPHLEDAELSKPHPLKSSSSANVIGRLLVIWWLLIGVLVSACHFALPSPVDLKAAQDTAQLATMMETDPPAAGEHQVAGEQLFETYTTWLQASHAHAVLHGQEAPMPSQF